ncbi:MAG: hypothetical protein H8E22_08300 [Candidatus Cloacimonetes bacterium]|nr:hypothetical protein [Candidatus Cloacimonadota bacterium]
MKKNTLKSLICENLLKLRGSACRGVFRFICPVKSLFSISLGSEEDWRAIPSGGKDENRFWL